MKEFTSAVEDVVNEDDYQSRLKAATQKFIDKGETPAEAERLALKTVDDDLGVVEFKIDGRDMKAFRPNDGQLTFMMASLGRGQSQDSRFASVINLMLSTLRPSDQDYLEGRMLSQGRDRLPIKTIEEIFEYLVEQWFATPTRPQSDSVTSPPTDGQN